MIDVIESGGEYRVAGIVQPVRHGDATVLGYPVLGDDAALQALLDQVPRALVTVGQFKEAAVRERLFGKLLHLNAEIPVVISPRAHVSRHAQLGRGTAVLHGAIINAAAVIGENCIVNSLALVEHDAEVGAHSHVSTGARINGGASVGERCFIGSGAIVHHGVRIGEGAVIAAGCVVNRDIEAHTVVRYRV